VRNERALDAARLVARGQGLYYLATGVWPILSMRTFEAVTGRKRDRWLVRVVGVLAIAFGGLVLREANRPRPEPAPGLAGSAAFGAASLWYWASGRLNHAYALDGIFEAATFGAWLALSGQAKQRPDSRLSRADRPTKPLIAVL
jgi:hypothetical protein